MLLLLYVVICIACTYYLYVVEILLGKVNRLSVTNSIDTANYQTKSLYSVFFFP